MGIFNPFFGSTYFARTKSVKIVYSGDPKSDLVWILNGAKEVGLQMVWILNGIWNPETQPFEIWTNGKHFVKNHLKSRPKRPVFEWVGIY